MKLFTTMYLGVLFIAFNANAFHHERHEYTLDKFTTKNTLVLEQSNKLKVDIVFRNFKDCDKQKVFKAKEILEKVMNSQEFKERVLSFTFNGTRQFHDNNGMTNFQIYNHLMTAEEDLIPGIDHIMNFDLTLYRSWNPFSKVKGYTLPDTIRIWIHKKFFRKSSWTAVDVAANMAHEWVHKMGFGHDYYYNEDRPYSVPYAIGNIVADVAYSMGYK